MTQNHPIPVTLFYTFTCPNCRILRRMLDEVLPQFDNKFKFKKQLANSPIGMVKTLKLGIHAVPTLLIDNKVVFRSVPTKEELINKLDNY